MPQASTSSLRHITELPEWEKSVRAIQQRRDWLDRIHIELTEISAPTFREAARADYVAGKFRELGLSRVRTDSAGNVLAERPGSDAACIVIAAHLDTVVPPGISVQVKRSNGRFYAPGISDNGAGLAALIGVAAALEHSRIATSLSLTFVGTVGEEGEGDLYGMRRLFAQEHFRRPVQGVLVVDGACIERITVAGLGSRRFLIEVTGPGGHSWSNFGRVNPIHALSDIITQLNRTALPTDPRATLSIGMIHGGTAVNVIPNSAWMKVDIRSTAAQEIERLSVALERTVAAAVEDENRRGSGALESKITLIGDRPAAQLSSSARILQVIGEVDQHLGIRSRVETSSTDANIPLAMGVEAIATGAGGTAGDVHTPDEWYDSQGRELGLQRLLLAVLALAGVIEGAQRRD